jgi:hypothetical protein
MSDDILPRLHKELEGTTAISPAVCELLCEAAEEIERLRVRLASRERFLKVLLAARDKRDGGDELTPGVQNEVARRRLVEQPEAGH